MIQSKHKTTPGFLASVIDSPVTNCDFEFCSDEQSITGGPITETGFSLIELLITLAIVGLLATMSYPSYQRYITKSHRFDGQSALLELAYRMENYRLEHGTYKTATIAKNKHTDVLSQSLSPQSRYVLSITIATDNTYLLRATPTIPDKECQSLTLSSSSTKSVTAASIRGIDQCW